MNQPQPERKKIAYAAGATCGGAKKNAPARCSSLLSLPAGDAPPARGATCGGAKKNAPARCSSLLSLPAGDAPPARGALPLLSSQHEVLS
jgi:hypothetical protein